MPRFSIARNSGVAPAQREVLDAPGRGQGNDNTDWFAQCILWIIGCVAVEQQIMDFEPLAVNGDVQSSKYSSFIRSVPCIHQREGGSVQTLKARSHVLAAGIGSSARSVLIPRRLIFPGRIEEAIVVVVRVPDGVQGAGWAGQPGVVGAAAV